jgi:hypothetical protein
MRSKRLTATISVILGGVLLSTSAISAPLQYNADLSGHASVVEKVWCRYGCGGGGGLGVGGLIGGLVGGAIIAGAATAAAQQQAQSQAVAQQHAASCAQRYRSYDPATDTYLSKGQRFQCQ